MAPAPDHADTIFALSSGRPPAGVAVIRISGPASRLALETMVGRIPVPRRATFACIRDPQTGETIDEALALWFPGPHSETGEDTAELQLHGGRSIVAAVLQALGRLPGFRLAEPGEFTRRAFENGRLDLTQVEALADLVSAETAAQRRQAFEQFRGLLGDRAEVWRQRAVEALALVEAGIDFSDEGDVPNDLVGRALQIGGSLAEEIAQALAGAGRGERLREGLWVVIAGPPNVGKSTLLNAIARREAAIVSPIPGTTRDVLEVHLDLAGYPVNLIDTAGIRSQSDDPIEREGMRRAREIAERADLVLWLVDAGVAASPLPEPAKSKAPQWIVVSKADLIDERTRPRLEWRLKRCPEVHYLSAAKGSGISALVASIAHFAERHFTFEPALVTRERQRTLLSETLACLRQAQKLAKRSAGEELIAEQLRLAVTTLGRLTGRVDVEEVLGAIFREFCVGK